MRLKKLWAGESAPARQIRKEFIAMQIRPRVIASRKRKHKPRYFRRPFACAFSTRRMAITDYNQPLRSAGSRVP
jgi:hypothetical protein